MNCPAFSPFDGCSLKISGQKSWKKPSYRPYAREKPISILKLVMKRLFFLYSFLMFLLLFSLGMQAPIIHAQDVASLTPTYDPLTEPFVPENPSKYELGRNWYWHHCMPCHGNVGQGLTDEFREIWPEDHQNCWGRGCHTGHSEDFGFPIPTVVPAIVNNEKLANFTSQQALYEYLKATHPPQHPGYLSEEQYRAITFYVFTLNHRVHLESPSSTPTSVSTIHPEPVEARNKSLLLILIFVLGLGITFIIAIFLRIRKQLT